MSNIGGCRARILGKSEYKRIMTMSNIKTLKRVRSGASKFDGVLSKEVLSEEREIGFCFKPDSEECYWPVNSSLYELINDGWEVVVKLSAMKS